MFVLQAAVVKGRGGIATAIAHYERMFRAGGVASTVVFRGPSTALLREQGADVVEAPALLTSPLAGVLPLLGGLRRAVLERARGADMVTIAHSDLALGALRRMFPDAITIAPCHSDKTKRKARADIVITLNPQQHAMVKAALPATRVAMLGNPFVPAPGERGPARSGAGGFRVNFLGRLEGFKDPLTLVRAFGASNLPADVELRIIGAGPLDEDVRAAAAGSGRRVVFAGWLTDAFAHFDEGDLLVLPSDWESYSYVIREALHHGVPVVASDIHVHRTALEDGAYGLLFPVGDWQALARALETAHERLPELRAMAARGGEDVRARYGAAPFLRALESEIVAARARRKA